MWFRRISLFLLLPLTLSFTGTQKCSGQGLEWQWLGDSTVDSSIRGVVVDPVDSTIWVSGSHGIFGRKRPTDPLMVFREAKGFELYDFRDVYAFDQDNALLMSSGHPTVIIRTEDGGRSWEQVFYSSDKKVFLDGFDFWGGGRGICMADPINGSFLLLESTDYGKFWKKITGPSADSGEAAFAASGTSLKCLKGGYSVMVTGGLKSHVVIGTKFSGLWRSIPLDSIVQGSESKGCYSVDAYIKGQKLFVCGVGGDYKDPDRFSWEDEYGHKKSNAFFCEVDMPGGSIPLNNRWLGMKRPIQLPQGYCSCVKFVNENELISCGPTGVFYSFDKGMHWERISVKGFNTMAMVGERKVLLSGSGMNISILDLSKFHQP